MRGTGGPSSDELERLARAELDALRERFVCSPIREIEFVDSDNRELVGGLVHHRIVLNRPFILEFARERGVEPSVVLRAAIARSLTRYQRVPANFAQSLRLFAAMRTQSPDSITARRFLEIYLALWAECDLYERRGLHKELCSLYRASLNLPQEELDNLEMHYLILVAVLQHRWGVDLGLPPQALKGWRHLAQDLASIDYLESQDRVGDAAKFARLFGRCCQVLSERTAEKGKEKDQGQEPTHWPLECTIESFTMAHDVGQGITELVETLGIQETLSLLGEFTQDYPGFLSQLGVQALLESSRWLYYRELAEKYRLKVEPRPFPETGRAYPVSLKDYEIGDSLQKIALLQSFGKPATPGITVTWVDSGQQPCLEHLESPDLLILIDSSGSMPNPNLMSWAVLSGFVAANAYLDRGGRVAVLNFSGTDIALGFSRDREGIYKHLAAYQGGMTILHPETIDRWLAQGEGEVDILLISDLDISNFHEAISGLAKHTRTHRLFVFLVQSDKAPDEAQVAQIRTNLPEDVELHAVHDGEVLVDLVLGATRRSQDEFAHSGRENPSGKEREP